MDEEGDCLMAGIFFSVGEEKKRAGVYQRYEKVSSPVYVGASDGIVALIMNGTWGPLNTVQAVENVDQAKKLYGTGGSANLIEEILAGGAVKVLVSRIGADGTCGTATMQSADAATVVKLTGKYPGTRKIDYTFKQSIDDSAYYNFVLTEDGAVIEKFTVSGDMTAEKFAEKINADSAFVTVEATGTGAISGLSDAVTGSIAGTNPMVTTANYSNGLTAVEPCKWNTLCVDSNSVDVHALVSAYMTRIYQDGKMGIAVLGEPISVVFATRLEHAAAFNDYKVAYIGGGWYDSNDVLKDGYVAAARMAGVIASTPSNTSITHKVVGGAVRPAEMLTNLQYESCIDNGMIMFSQSPAGTVWIESGINTLVSPTGNDDAGWKKIKRTKVRFELMDRVNDSVDPLIGTINNDADGRAVVIQTAQGVVNKMMAEAKLAAGSLVEEDPANEPTPDSAWFVITAYDIDTLEKIYFTYKYSFATSA